MSGDLYVYIYIYYSVRGRCFEIVIFGFDRYVKGLRRKMKGAQGDRSSEVGIDHGSRSI